MLRPETRFGARLLLLALSLGACSDAGEETGLSALGDTASKWTIIDAGDFNGDGLEDAIWSDEGTQRTAVFLLRGPELLEAGPAIPGPAGAGWNAVNSADFNLDGMEDVPFFDPGSRQISVWLMRGTHVMERGPAIPGLTGGGWSVADTHDLDGDGMADLVWHDPGAQRLAVWLMRGNRVSVRGPEIAAPAGAGWTVAHIDDFNLDGRGDILWYNTISRRIAVWLMAGTAVLEAGPELPAPGDGWIAATGADFDGDGMSDVIWNDPTTNRILIWLMRGTRPLTAGPEIAGPPGDGWSVGAAGDTNGDGMADVMWQNTKPTRMAVWTMRGTHVLTQGPEIPGPR